MKELWLPEEKKGKMVKHCLVKWTAPEALAFSQFPMKVRCMG